MSASKTKLTSAECGWLIKLAQKDIAQTEEWLKSNTEFPPRLFELRIDNMRDVIQTLENMQRSIARAAMARADIPRESR